MSDAGTAPPSTASGAASARSAASGGVSSQAFQPSPSTAKCRSVRQGRPSGPTMMFAALMPRCTSGGSNPCR